MRLRGRQGREAVAKVRSKLGQLRLTVGREAGGRAEIFSQRIVASGSSAERHVATRVQRQPVKPGRESSLAAKLAELDAEPGKCVLRGVVRIVGIAEHMAGEASYARFVTLAERRQRSRVAVLGALHENRIAEPLVGELGLRAKRSADSTA